MLQSAFEDKPLCVFRHLAELLQLSVEEVCADFDACCATTGGAWHLRQGGASSAWAQRANAVLSLQGDLVTIRR